MASRTLVGNVRRATGVRPPVESFRDHRFRPNCFVFTLTTKGLCSLLKSLVFWFGYIQGPTYSPVPPCPPRGGCAVGKSGSGVGRGATAGPRARGRRRSLARRREARLRQPVAGGYTGSSAEHGGALVARVRRSARGTIRVDWTITRIQSELVSSLVR